MRGLWFGKNAVEGVDRARRHADSGKLVKPPAGCLPAKGSLDIWQQRDAGTAQGGKFTVTVAGYDSAFLLFAPS